VASTVEVAPLTPRRQQEHSHPRPRCCPHHRHSKRRRCCRRLRRRAAATPPRRSPCAPCNTRCHRERCSVPLKCRMQLDARRRSIRLLDRPGRVCFHRSNWWWSTGGASRDRGLIAQTVSAKCCGERLRFMFVSSSMLPPSRRRPPPPPPAPFHASHSRANRRRASFREHSSHGLTERSRRRPSRRSCL
jgi:hypothetical protein